MSIHIDDWWLYDLWLMTVDWWLMTDESGRNWMKVDQCGWNGWKWVKVDENQLNEKTWMFFTVKVWKGESTST